MEVVVSAPDFHLDSACTTPYVSAPSSPKHHSGKPFDFFRHYTSAPASPTRASLLYAHFDAVASTRSPPPPPASSGVPFHWEEKPGTPKSCEAKEDGEFAFDGAYEFSFDFSGHLDKDDLPALTAADELFEEGKIRPLKLPPRLRLQASTDDGSSRASSPSSSRGLWSPRHRGRVEAQEECDPFAAAMVEATRERGREREKAPPPDSLPPSSFSRSRKGSRSLSPLRGVGRFFKSTMTPNSPSSDAPAAPLKNGNGSKKWRLKDLLLFRSASEGRATGNRSKDPLRKYTLLPSLNNRVEYSEKLDSKNSSFRSSTDGSGSIRTASSFSHQMHYSTNRPAAEEHRRKTALPYRQSFFGCLRFNPALLSITKGFARQ
ncbi:uncharacterized protein LOC122038809 [Zingiber officinale]|uniref:Calmodulin-binding protein n=1 Tax=Zingiber officinale TaxID=94328 RepID=A0A8J5I9Z9_ZINOF|nr:uncharacterized protein LOC122038809 [Zingiber officinale]KAG6539079.1 hypothetical protein ZIOFF_004232 [Zingiber officinale]